MRWIVAVTTAARAAWQRGLAALLLSALGALAPAQAHAQTAAQTPAQARAQAAPPACPERLRVAFPDASAEPFLTGQGDDFGKPPGLLVDWVRAALRQLGCLERAELLRLPARRVRVMVETGQLDLVAGVGEGGPIAALLALPPHEGRRQEFDFSLGAVEYAFYARRGTEVRWDGQALAALPAGARVGVTAGSRAEALAQERGWPQEPAPSHESALQKLVAGRTPLLLVHSFYVDERLRRDAELAHQIIKLSPVVERRRLHVGASPALAQTERVFMQRLWRELCRQSQAAKADGACRLAPS
jgi:hypothetical protein